LNEVLGYFIPSLTYVLSRKIADEDQFVFRPFTDDADKVSETYEPIVRKLLSPKPSEVIVDIGANIGLHTIWLSRKVGSSGLVIAVEPEQTNFLILTLNKSLNGLNNVLTMRAALAYGKTKGELVIPRPTLMGQASTQARSSSSRSYVANVDFETLDGIIFARDIPRVSAIKIDVEGAETSVLQGAEKTIEKFGPRLIIEAHGDDNLRSVRLLLKSMKMTIVSETVASSRRDENRHFVFAIHSLNLDTPKRN
jgi:FkbM family methyltransferase